MDHVLHILVKLTINLGKIKFDTFLLYIVQK